MGFREDTSVLAVASAILFGISALALIAIEILDKGSSLAPLSLAGMLAAIWLLVASLRDEE